MPWFRNLTIRNKLQLAMLLVSSMMVLLASSVYMVHDYMYMKQAMEEKYSTLGDVLASNVASAMVFGDSKSAHQILQAIGSEPSVLFATAYKETGEPFVHFLPKASRYDGKWIEEQVLEYTRGVPAACSEPVFADGHLHVCKPISLEGELLGRLFLTSDLNILHKEMIDGLGIGLIILILVLAFNVILSRALARGLANPIVHLTDMMRKVSETENYGISLPIESKDEIGELTKGFNIMLAEIGKRDEYLKEYSANLESMVEERTAKLGEQAHIIDQIHDSVVSTDLSGAITSWNKGAERLFGYNAEEAMGRHISFVYPEDEHTFLAEQVIGGLMARGDQEVEVRMQRKSGEIFHAHLSLSLLRDAEGVTTGMIGYSMDITDRIIAEQEMKLAREAAESASQAKSEFLSSMSHELRTPLNAVLGFGQLLQRDKTLPEKSQNFVRDILKAGSHLLQLINEVLNLAKIDSGHMNLSLEPVALRPIIEESLGMVANLAEKRHIQIGHSGAEGMVVRADHTRLKQAVINLLSNAIKYNNENGSVMIQVEAVNPDRIRLYVKDNGPGIPKELHAELFEPFNRLGAQNSGIEGTGIGLTITRRIVELMDGTVGVESESGAGSRFWIELPIGSEASPEQTDGREATVITTPAPSDEAAQHTVLYIEDNPVNLKVVTHILSERPHIRLLAAHIPGLGIELAKTHQPDLILLDINLPGMNGFQVMEVFKREESLQGIPVVAISANAMDSDIERGKQAGFHDYLTKPLNIDQFLQVVDECIAAGDA